VVLEKHNSKSPSRICAKFILVYEQAYGADANHLTEFFIDRNEDGIVNEQDKYRFHKTGS
jgi:hypothetical protein